MCAVVAVVDAQRVAYGSIGCRSRFAVVVMVAVAVLGIAVMVAVVMVETLVMRRCVMRVPGCSRSRLGGRCSQAVRVLYPLGVGMEAVVAGVLMDDQAHARSRGYQQVDGRAEQRGRPHRAGSARRAGSALVGPQQVDQHRSVIRMARQASRKLPPPANAPRGTGSPSRPAVDERAAEPGARRPIGISRLRFVG